MEEGKGAALGNDVAGIIRENERPLSVNVGRVNGGFRPLTADFTGDGPGWDSTA